MGFLRRLFDPAGDLIADMVRAYYSARGEGLDHDTSMQRVLANQFPDSLQRQREIWRQFRSVDFVDAPVDEAKQLVIGIYSDKIGWPDNLPAALKLTSRIDAAFDMYSRHFRSDEGT